MKGIYDWVPWFRELSGRIAEGDPESLLKRANKVWEGQEKPPLIKDVPLHLDPLSFVYFLTTQGEDIFKAVGKAFDMKTPLWEADDAWIFPQTIEVAWLFLHRQELDPKPMWNLFRAAHRTKQSGDRIDSDLWNAALDNPGVGIPSLTQMLCLTNPYSFLALDKKSMGIASSILCLKGPSIEKRIEGNGYAEYASIQGELHQLFPKCHLYEIDRFLYLQHKVALMTTTPTVFQVSTNVYGHREGDYWGDFESENAVFTGSGSSRGGRVVYAVGDPRPGDVVLVRTGTTVGRGIGVVVDNDFKGKRWHKAGRIHVIWINREEHALELTRTQITEGAFSEVPPALLDAFRTPYRSSFKLIERLTQTEDDSGEDNGPPNRPTLEGRHPLNQILFGPPGVGKTWNTVARAVAIVEGKDVEEVEKERQEHQERPDRVKRQFDKLRETGQVVMVTFHQNYAYEDFVEGIRPALSEEDDADVDFVLRWGVFREIAETAERNRRASRDLPDHLDVDGLIDSFLDFVADGIDREREFVLDVPESKSPYPILKVTSRGHGGVRLRRPQKGQKGLSSFVWRKHYRAFRDGKIKKYQDIPAVHAKSGWAYNARFHYAMLQMLEQYEPQWKKAPEPEREGRRNFVLILDEINRGNIARIFGELITLVEESRRIGREDETKVTLPNSGDEFGVPENLYLIGTMNTADRSIALLDTALRRRFEFEEMMPDSSLLNREVEGVHLGELLKAVNGRIRFLRDREHQIGHTYFLGVSDLKGLKRVFQKEILPLLQEYFYDDWAKILAVLRDNGFVRPVKRPEELPTDLVDSDAKAFEVLEFENPKWNEPSRYQSIYDEKAVGTENFGSAEKETDVTGD